LELGRADHDRCAGPAATYYLILALQRSDPPFFAKLPAKTDLISNRQGIAAQIATSGELAASELIPQEAFRSLG
jgi:hypothetical protein